MSRHRFSGTDSYIATADLKTAVNAAVAVGRPLLVKGEDRKGGMKRVKRFAQAIRRCKGTDQIVFARTTKSNSAWGTKNGPFLLGGVEAAIANVEIKSRRRD